MMMRKILLSFTIIFLIHYGTHAQDKGYIIGKLPFCSSLSDEFSPVYYGDGIVFCSNIRDNSIIGYRDDRTRLFKIFYASLIQGKKSPRLLSKELTTSLNDGPASFSKDGSIIYFSRNNNEADYIGNVLDTSNKLGIYRAEYVSQRWTGITPFEFNDPFYTFCMPSLSPGSDRIYFSSDMPGGYGGLDLYYCDKREDGWAEPVNLGAIVNTKGNETFPFAFYYAKLFFSSDGHPGAGGKDIFYTQYVNSSWIVPVPMDSTINSIADDFGIVFDSTLEKGYFSSNRSGSDDIYSLSTPPVNFTDCKYVSENNYCFLFFDERLHEGDTVRGEYVWDFGGGITRRGTRVTHCFPGKGNYDVTLNIYDTVTGDTVATPVSYTVTVADIEQAYIGSVDNAVTGNTIPFDGTEVNIPGFRLTDYFWNFGDGFIPGGPVMNKAYRKDGSYTVQLGLIGKNDKSGETVRECYMKNISIHNSYEEFERKSTFPSSADASASGELPLRIFFMNELSERQKNRIESSLKALPGKVLFLPSGILPESSPVLDSFIEIMKGNPEIRIDIVVHSSGEKPPDGKIDMSERWAREISMYFENGEMDGESFSCRGIGPLGSVLKSLSDEERKKPGLIEIIFMEKNVKR